MTFGWGGFPRRLLWDMNGIYYIWRSLLIYQADRVRIWTIHSSMIGCVKKEQGRKRTCRIIIKSCKLFGKDPKESLC